MTITLPVGTDGRRGLSSSSRAVRRLKALATIAASDADLASSEGRLVHTGSPAAQRRVAEAFLRDDVVPLADGATHKHPEYAAEYVRHADGGGLAGPYAAIAPTLREARAFLDVAT